MTIAHDGYNYQNPTHGLPVQVGPTQARIHVGKFVGVQGEAHIVDAPEGEDWILDITLDNYASEALLEDAIIAIKRKVGTLTGTLTVSGTFSDSYSQMTFHRVDVRRKFQNKVDDTWVAFLTLHFRKRGLLAAGNE